MAFSRDKMSINFTMGESVLFSRLRMIDAKFPLPNKNSRVVFKVILFNKSGDLVYKDIFPYEMK